jgi:predicted nucleic acid-binding protein
MIVVDASVIACAVVDDGEDGTRVRRRLLGQHVVVPEGVDARVAATLERLVRARRLTTARAEQAIGDLQDLPLDRVPQWPFLARAWQLRERISMLQAVTVAVAESYGVPLVTGDRAYLKATAAICEIDLI